MKITFNRQHNNQSGTSLLVVMMVLMGVTAVGIMAIQTVSTELEVATNDKLHKMAFFAADGATEMTTELIEQNIEERGFPNSTWGNTHVLTLDFFNNEADPDADLNKPSNTNRDIEISGIGGCQVYIRVYGQSTYTPGSALQIAAGYEGVGKGIAGGGGQKIFHIRGAAVGASQSTARIHPLYRHVM